MPRLDFVLGDPKIGCWEGRVLKVMDDDVHLGSLYISAMGTTSFVPSRDLWGLTLDVLEEIVAYAKASNTEKRML